MNLPKSSKNQLFKTEIMPFFEIEMILPLLLFLFSIWLGIYAIPIMWRTHQRVFLQIKLDKTQIILTNEQAWKQLQQEGSVSLKCENNYYHLSKEDPSYERLDKSKTPTSIFITCEGF